MVFKIEPPTFIEIQKLVSKGYDLTLDKHPFFSLAKCVCESGIVDINIYPSQNNTYLIMRLINNKLVYKDTKELEDVVNSYRDCINDIFDAFRIINRVD